MSYLKGIGWQSHGQRLHAQPTDFASRYGTTFQQNNSLSMNGEDTKHGSGTNWLVRTSTKASKDSSQGSRFSLLAFYILLLTSYFPAFSQVNKGEYFFDTDPGIGNGFNLPVSSTADSVTINQSISVNGLTTGFHTMYVRTRMSKKWSETESRSFFITAAGSSTAGPVSGLEYFFDTDPGVGFGTKITINPAADSSEKTSIIPISSLTTGFHTLYIRAKNNRGYGMTESRSFFIISSSASSAGPISGLEYFFDIDPGVGLGTKITINPAADSSEKTSIISISGLTTGFHTLYIRAKSNRGYGMTESRSFFITSLTANSAGPISGLEYFFDTDPGVGLGTKIGINPAADSSEKTSIIPVSSLTSGFHTLYIRAKNNRGYGMTESRSFFIISSNSLNSGPVSKMEYFIDTDPGVGLGTAIAPFTSGDSVEVTRTITIPTTITLGDHKLYVRSKTTGGRWALTEVNDFNIACGPPEITSTQSQICPGASTIISMTGGNLPGTYQWIRNGVAIPGANAFTFSATLTGTYRLKYVNGTCTDTSAALVVGAGAAVSATITPSGPTALCSSLTVDFAANAGNGLTYQWLLNNNPISGQTNQQLADVSTVGSYSVIVTNATGCKDTSTVVSVTIGPGIGNPSVFPQASWNVYAYSGNDINLGSGILYRGFYSLNTLNVNTLDQWGSNASPSSAAGYQGCAVPVDNFTWVVKRKGFPSGPYVLNIPANDDNINVLVNGVSIYTAGCCGGSPSLTLGNLDANSTIEIRMAEFSGGSNLTFNLTITPLLSGSISADQTICGGGVPAILANANAALGGSTNTITYQWQDSTAGNNWADISLATNATFQPGSLSETRWYRRKALNGGDVVISNQIQITIVFAQGNPATFGNNGWSLFAYQGTDLELGTGTSYRGFYNVSALDINTDDQWVNTASPSAFSNYAGCPVPIDNFTFVLKRRGFTPGSYLLNIPAHDDLIRVYVNGVQVFEHLSCCDIHNGIDLGALNANSTVEVRCVEFIGGAVARLAFVSSSFQAGVIGTDQTICAGIAPALLTNIQSANGGGFTNITYQWQDSLVGGSWQNINPATSPTFQAPILSGTKWYRRKATGGSLDVFSNEVKITVLPAPAASISQNGPITVCNGDAIQLTGTFSTGSTHQWLRNGFVITGQTGATLNASQAGTYKAVASAGTCTDTSNSVVINVNTKPTPIVTPAGPVSICANGSTTLTLSNAVNGQSIQWKNDGTPVSGGNSITVSTDGVFYVVSTITSTGCKDSSNVVSVNVINPVVTPTGTITICQGSSTNLIVSNTGSAEIQWLRNETPIGGATTPTLSVSQAGTYKAISIVPGLCSDTSNGVVINISPLPLAEITAGGTSFCENGALTLNANTGPGLSYQWKLNGNNINLATNSSFVAIVAGSYTVEVRNAQNCLQVSIALVLTTVPNITWFIDADNDSYGTGATVSNCFRPQNGFLSTELSATSGDCDDSDNTINAGRQFFTFAGGQSFGSALTSPFSGTPYTTFRFEVIYTDLNNGPAPATFPRVVLDYEGNGSLNDQNDRTILMQQADSRDNNTNDGKKFFTTVNSLPSGQNYTTRILTSIGGCATTIGPFNYPDVFILSDIQIFANDITFSNTNPDVASPLQINAVIHNVSDFSAQNFVVHLVNQYNPLIVYPDIVVANLAPHSDQTVTWNIITPAEAAWCPMQVSIDFTNIIEETNELDNSAIRPFVNGPFNVPGEISVSPSVSPSTVVGVSGASVTLVGSANYSGTAVPLQDPSVAGAEVTFTVQPGGQTFTTYTNSSGQINFSFAVSLTPGTYTITGTITDFTLTTTFTTTFVVVPPVCLVDLTANVTVSSNNIVQGESITGNIRVTNTGCVASTDSTLMSISQSGGLPIKASVKVPALAVGAFYDVPLSAITFNTPGTFSICGTADGAFQVSEQSEGNNSDCKVITVIPFLPDIFPVSCGVGGSVYLDSQTYTHTFSFYNSGGSATGPFTVRILRFKDGNQIGSFDRPVSNLGRQSYGSVSIDVTYDETGSYSYAMACDIPVPPGVVAETNEDNNTSNCGILILAPQTDLAINGCENFDVDPVDPAFPGNITLKARVVNQGNLTATAPILVRFTRTSGTTDDVTINTNLAPGQSVLVTKQVSSTAPATDTATVMVDPLNVFNEFNEGNNSRSNTLCHESAPTDNYCGGNWWSSTYLLNQAIFLNVPVTVSGLYNISQLKVRFFVSGPGLNGTLNLGDATLNNVSETCGCPYVATLPVNFAFPAEGEYIFTFVTDPDNLYSECNEGNNTLVRRVRVSGLPDMRMLSQGINPSLLNPDVGEPITIDANYENIGLANIDQTMKVKLLVDEIAVDSQIVNGLVNGDNFTVNFTTPWSSTLVGSHIIRTIIDSDNEIVEGNEANNEATRAVIVGAAANLYFQVFQPDNSTPALGQSINILSRIGNNGDVEVEGVVQFFYINNQGDTIQIGVRSLALNGHDSVSLSVPWIVADNNTTILGKIINATVMEFNYEDNMATAPIGGFGVSTNSTPSCAGKTNGTLTAVTSGGTAPFIVNWSTGFIGPVLTSGPGLYSGTVTDANNISVNFNGSIPNIVGTKYFKDADGDGYGDFGIDSVDCTKPEGYVQNSSDCNDGDPAIYKPTPVPSISHTGSLTFCTGSSVTLSVPVIPGVSYVWSTNVAQRILVVNTAGSFTVTASADSSCSATSLPIVTQVITTIRPTASITVSPDSVICTGTNVTFTSTISGGGALPSIEWYLNDVFAKEGPSFSTDSLEHNDKIQLVLTSDESCASPVVVLSKKITMSVSNSLLAIAGTDQEICGNSTTISGNSSGNWTKISGSGLINSSSSATTTVSNLSVGLNEFIWSISGGTCAASSDTVSITVNPAPSIANAGSDQNLCVADANLSGNVLQTGSGTWTLISGTGTIEDESDPTTLVENLGIGQNIFVWTIATGNCPSSTDTVSIIRQAKPGIALAGDDQTICGDSTSLSANIPAIGTGLWTVISGSGILSNTSSASSPVSGLSSGLNTFVWTISNGLCDASKDTVSIIVNSAPSVANAGSDQTICGDSTRLSGNIPAVGTGSWTVISGSGEISNSGSGISDVTNLSVGLNEFVWTISNGDCKVSTDTVSINVNLPPSTANAGSDQTICEDSTSLSVNIPAIGTSSWTVISGSGSVNDEANPIIFENLGIGENVFVLSISSGNCLASTDTVSIFRQAKPDISLAGGDQTICDDSTSLSGNIPNIGIGSWSVVSGSGIISNSSLATSPVTGLSSDLNKFVWTIANGTCGVSTDTVSIVVNPSPSVANAGLDQTICDSITTLSGNSPQTGSGLWTVISGTSTISEPSLANPVVSSLGIGENKFVWSVSNGNCPASKDTVLIVRQTAPTIANAGSGQTLCSTNSTLSGNTPLVGTGLWTVVSGSGIVGNSSLANTVVTNLSIGLNEFVWNISNGVCLTNSDTLTILVNAGPSPSNAGTDQTICGDSTALDANEPLSGNGAWSIVSGSGNLSNGLNAKSSISNLSAGQVKLVWTISSANCPAVTDTVSIFVNPSIGSSNAGPDQNICANFASLAGNIPANGQGTWTLVSGSGAITNPNSESTTVTSLGQGANVFKWEISNGVCPVVSDLVSIFSNVQSIANAGVDKLACDTVITLNAITGNGVTGTWTQIVGTGIIVSPNSDTTIISGLSQDINSFVWTVGSGFCASSDTVNLLFVKNNLSLGPDTGVCQNASLTLTAGSGIGSYLWNTSATSASITINQAGQYSVRVTTPESCVFIDTINVILVICPSVEEILASKAEVSVYPNPFRNKIQLEINNFAEKEVGYKLISSTGVEVHNGKAMADSGKVNKEISPGKLASGFYILELSYGNSVVRRKLILE